MDWVRDAASKRQFESFAAEVSDPLLRAGYLITGNASDAEDLVQETLRARALREVDDLAEFRWALARLPARQRAVLVPRYWADLPVAEVAGILGCSAAAATVAGLALSGTFGSASPSPGPNASQAQLTAFSLASNQDGTTTLILRPGVPFHPSALQHLLARHHVPALVRGGGYCYSDPQPSAPGAVRTYPKIHTIPPGEPLPTVKMVINPAALPAGTEIGFGFFYHNRVIIQNIIDQHSYACATSPPSPS